jgi:Tol biopolymer transport system component
MGVARTRIAFTSDRTAESNEGRPARQLGASKEIHIMDYDGQNVRRITVNRSLNLGPTWGPDGRTLAYSSYRRSLPGHLCRHARRQAAVSSCQRHGDRPQPGPGHFT